MNIKFKETIYWLLGIAFVSAVLSDIIYGKAEFASEYLIGQFIGEIFSLSMSFAFVLCLLWFMFRVFFKELFTTMFYHRDIEKIKPKLRNIKQRSKGK